MFKVEIRGIECNFLLCCLGVFRTKQEAVMAGELYFVENPADVGVLEYQIKKV